jgi:hypothetical protein
MKKNAKIPKSHYHYPTKYRIADSYIFTLAVIYS